MSIFGDSDTPGEIIYNQQKKIEKIMENVLETMESFDQEFLEEVDQNRSERAFQNAVTTLENMIIRFETDRIQKIERKEMKLSEALDKYDEENEVWRVGNQNREVVEDVVQKLEKEIENLKIIHEEAEEKWDNGEKKAAIEELKTVTGRDMKRLEEIREKFWDNWIDPVSP